MRTGARGGCSGRPLPPDASRHCRGYPRGLALSLPHSNPHSLRFGGLGPRNGVTSAISVSTETTTDLRFDKQKGPEFTGSVRFFAPPRTNSGIHRRNIKVIHLHIFARYCWSPGKPLHAALTRWLVAGFRDGPQCLRRRAVEDLLADPVGDWQLGFVDDPFAGDGKAGGGLFEQFAGDVTDRRYENLFHRCSSADSDTIRVSTRPVRAGLIERSGTDPVTKLAAYPHAGPPRPEILAAASKNRLTKRPISPKWTICTAGVAQW